MNCTIKFSTVAIFSLLIVAECAFAQLERRQAQTNRPVDLTFLASRNINLYTVVPVARGELHSTVMHSFGEFRTGVNGFWGLDSGANVRLGLEYGVSDNFSMALGRNRIDKVVDLTGRIALLRQTVSGSTPVSVSFIPSVGINTSDLSFLSDGYSFNERLNYALSLPVARKFSEKVSLQLSPILVHFNRVGAELSLADPAVNTWHTVALAGRYMVSSHTAISLQYIPPLTDADNISANVAIGLDVATGGHVFQIFLTTSRGLNEQYVIAGNNGDFFGREFRIGFNINRAFQLIE